MKKKLFVTFMASSLAVGALGIGIQGSFKTLGNLLFASDVNYGVYLDSSNAVTSVGEGGTAVKTINTKLGNPIEFAYAGASVVSEKHVGLATGGSIMNSTLIMGIGSATVTFTGGLDVYGSSDGFEFTKLATLTSGSKESFEKTWDVVKFVATDDSEIDSIDLSHSCATRFTGVQNEVKIVGFDSVVNIGPLGQSGRRGWGEGYWAAMNFGRPGDGGRFQFFAEVAGLHEFVWNYNCGDDASIQVYVNDGAAITTELPSTGRWYNNSNPVGENLVVQYELKQGWNEIRYTRHVDTYLDKGNYFQIGSLTMKKIEGRRFDPNELDTRVKSIHLEAEQGLTYGMENGNPVEGAGWWGYNGNCSNGVVIGGIECEGCGSGMTFNVPSGNGGQYDLKVKAGCDANTTMNVYVDDFVSEWANDCVTTSYQLIKENAGGFDNPNYSGTIRVTLPDGWCRVRVEFANRWFTLDCVDLTRVLA